MKASRTAAAEASSPCGLWAASRITGGALRASSSLPGEETAPSPAATSSGLRAFSPPPTNASTAATATAAFWAWWAPNSGNMRSGYSPASPCTVMTWPPTAVERPVTANSTPSKRNGSPSSRARSSRTCAASGCCAALTRKPWGLMIPAFSRAICPTVSPSMVVWSRPIGVTTDTAASATLVASHVPPMPTSRTMTSTGSSAKTANARTVRTSKYVRRGAPYASSFRSTSSRYGAISE